MLTVLVVPILAQDSPQTVSPGLAGAKIFALGPVGYAPKTSQEERQFKAVMALKPDKAKQELEKLYSSGNPQAMSYALVGIRKSSGQVVVLNHSFRTSLPARIVYGLSMRVGNDLNGGTMGL